MYRPAPGQCNLYFAHAFLSRCTNLRSKCLPYDGTLDPYVLFLITALNCYAGVYGLRSIADRGKVLSLRGTEEDNTRLIAVIFAAVEAAPGLLFLWCAPILLSGHLLFLIGSFYLVILSGHLLSGHRLG